MPSVTRKITPEGNTDPLEGMNTVHDKLIGKHMIFLMEIILKDNWVLKKSRECRKIYKRGEDWNKMINPFDLTEVFRTHCPTTAYTRSFQVRMGRWPVDNFPGLIKLHKLNQLESVGAHRTVLKGIIYQSVSALKRLVSNQWPWVPT